MSDRDPKACPQCGAVNPWTREVCRICGTDLSHALTPPFEPLAREHPEPDPASDEEHEPSAAATERSGSGSLSWRWVLRGMLITLVLFLIAEVSLTLAVKSSPALLRFVDEVERIQNDTDPDDMAQVKKMIADLEKSDRESVSSLRIRLILITSIITLAPLLGGSAVGLVLAPGGILEGGLAACGGAIFMSALRPTTILIIAPASFILGMLGAFLGRAIRRRWGSRHVA